MCGGPKQFIRSRAYLSQWGIALADPSLELRGEGGGGATSATELSWESRQQISFPTWQRSKLKSARRSIDQWRHLDLDDSALSLNAISLMSWEILTRCKSLQFYDKKCTAALVGGSQLHVQREKHLIILRIIHKHVKTQIIFDLLWLLEITLADCITLLTLPGTKPFFFSPLRC